MSESARVLIRNAIWNGLGTASVALTGFFTAPFLIHALGETRYGLWIILGSLAGYFGLLDLGMRGAVGYFVAYYQGKNDPAGVSRVVSTALVMLGLAGVVALLGTVLIEPWFDRVFVFPADEAADVHHALVVVGVTLALSLFSNGFDAVLWGFQRFDLLNAVDILGSMARLGLTIYWVSVDPRLTTVAHVNLGIVILVALLKAGCCKVGAPSLRVSRTAVGLASAQEMFGYSSWTFLDGCFQTAKNQLVPLCVGALVGVALVTPYSVAARLVALMAAVMVALTGVLTPFATGLVAQGNTRVEGRLFVLGGRFGLAASLFLAGGLLWLGKPLIGLWVGERLEGAAVLLVVLAGGEIMKNAQLVTDSILLARRRVRGLALLGVSETVSVLLLVGLLVPPFELAGACWALALPTLLYRGIGRIWFGCRVLEIPVGRYLWSSFVPALVCALGPLAILAGVATWRPPQGWLEFAAYSLGYAGLFAVACVPLQSGLRNRDGVPPEAVTQASAGENSESSTLWEAPSEQLCPVLPGAGQPTGHEAPTGVPSTQ